MYPVAQTRKPKVEGVAACACTVYVCAGELVTEVLQDITAQAEEKVTREKGPVTEPNLGTYILSQSS